MADHAERLHAARKGRLARRLLVFRFVRGVCMATVLVAFCDARTASAEPPAPDTSRCSPGTRARLTWLIERLDEREGYADLWWRGWIGFYGVGAVIEGARAGVEDDTSERADLVVSAVKAVGGVTRLYFSRPVARLGSEPLRDESFADEAACRQRLEQAEDLLRQAAKESNRRWDWKAHLANVAINMAGAVIVTEGFHENDGWGSAALGIAVGEAMLWSHPWTGKDDLAEYQSRFASASGARWSLLPQAGGLRVQVRF